MTDQELAAKAADLLRERGHTKGTLEDGFQHVCALGALYLAATGNAHPYAGDPYSKIHGAVVLVNEAIGLPTNPGVSGISAAFALAEWNNEPERTEDEVVAAFRRAAGVAVHDPHEGALAA